MRLDDDGRSRRGVLDGVPRDVGESFRQAIRVPGAGQVAFDLQLNARPELLDDAPADLAQVGGLRFEREPSPEASAGEIEQLKDHPGHAFGCWR